jgi:SAM-dependent methyltransferase
MGNGYLYRWVTAAVRNEGTELRILDAGCGSAVLAGRLEGQQYFGVDFSRQQLVEARAPVCQADIRQMPFSDSHFDVVVSIQSVIYAAPASLAFNEITRVLKPGGLLIVTVPNLQGRKYRQLGPPPLVVGDWSVQAVVQLLADFEIEEIAWMGRWVGHPLLPVRVSVHLPVAGDSRTALAMVVKARKKTNSSLAN